jgi:hypothetical protein
MAPDAVRAFREGRGWTHEQMADEVGASPLEVAAWEAGTIRPPAKQEAWVRWLIAYDQWHARVIEAGLSPCPWAQAHAPDLRERMFTRSSSDWNWFATRPAERHHIDSCDACRSALDLARRTPPIPAPPGDDFDSPGARYHRWVERRPGWLQPPLRLIAALPLVGIAAVWMMPDADAGWPATVIGLCLGGGCGIVAYRLVRQGLGAFFSRRPYTAGVLAWIPGVAVALLGWNLLDAALHLTDARVLAAAGLSAAALGLVSGARVRREQDAERALEATRARLLAEARVPAAEFRAMGADAHLARR